MLLSVMVRDNLEEDEDDDDDDEDEDEDEDDEDDGEGGPEESVSPLWRLLRRSM